MASLKENQDRTNQLARLLFIVAFVAMTLTSAASVWFYFQHEEAFTISLSMKNTFQGIYMFALFVAAAAIVVAVWPLVVSRNASNRVVRNEEEFRDTYVPEQPASEVFESRVTAPIFPEAPEEEVSMEPVTRVSEPLIEEIDEAHVPDTAPAVTESFKEPEPPAPVPEASDQESEPVPSQAEYGGEFFPVIDDEAYLASLGSGPTLDLGTHDSAPAEKSAPKSKLKIAWPTFGRSHSEGERVREPKKVSPARQEVLDAIKAAEAEDARVDSLSPEIEPPRSSLPAIPPRQAGPPRAVSVRDNLRRRR